MATLGSLVATMELQSAQFTRGFQQAARAMNSQTAQMRQQTRLLNQNFNQLQKGVDGVRNSLNLAKVAFAALGLGAFVREVFRSATSFEAIQNGLKAATGSATGAAREFEFVRAEVERLGLDLESSAKNFTSLTAAARGTALEGQATRDIFSAVSGAMVVLGRDSEETRRALIAIEQMISKGNVSAEELRQQLGEVLPGAFQRAARAMGVTTQRLNKMLQLGEVTAAEMLPALAVELNKTFGAGLEAATTGALAQMNRFRSTVFELKAEFAESGFIDGLLEGLSALRESVKSEDFRNAARDLGEALGKAMSFAASVAVLLADNLDLVLSVLGGIIALKAAVFFGNLAAAIKTVATAALSLNVALLANPITAVAATIGLATVAAIYFRDKTIELGNVSFRTGDVLVGIWAAIKESIQGAIQTASAFLEVIVQIARGDMTAAWEAAKEAVQGYERQLLAAVTGWEAFKASARDRTVGNALAEISSLAFDFEENAKRAALAFSGVGTKVAQVSEEATKKAKALRDVISSMKIEEQMRGLNDPALKEFATTLKSIGVEFEVLEGMVFVEAQQLDLANELLAVIKESGAAVQTVHQAFEDVNIQIKQLEDLKSAYHATDDAVKAVTQSIEIENDLRQRGIPLWLAHASGLYDNLEAYQALKAEVDGLAEAQKKAQEEAKRTADLMLEPFRNAIEGIQRSFTDMFEDIFSGGIDSFTDLAAAIKRIFIRLAAEIAALMVIRPVLGNMLMGVGMGGLAQQMGMAGGMGGLGAMGPLGATMASGFSTVTNAINNLGTSFGFAASAARPTANPWGGPIGGFNFAKPGGLFGAQTLAGFLGAGATGAGIGALGGSLFGLSGAGTAGSAIGGGLGGAAGSLFGPMGTIIGSVAGSALGGLIGGFFGGKPSDKGQASEINFLTGVVKEWGQTGSKFSQENRDAATTFANSAVQLADTLKALTGGTLSGGLQITVGSRDALRLSRGGEEFARTRDPKEFISLITQTIASSIKGVGGIQAQILKRADTSTPESLIADLEFGRVFEELTRQARPLTDQLNALKDQFAGARAQARRLGLDVDLLKERQREAVSAFRGSIMTELRGLAGEVSPMAAAFAELRDRFRAVRQEAKALGFNRRERDEIQALQQQAVRSFRQGIMEELRALANEAMPAVRAFEELRAQFRAARQDAAAVGLNRNEIKRLQQQATSQFRQGFLADLNQSAGAGTNTFIDQMKELTQHFAQARKEARGIGVSVVRVNQIQARAVANLQASFMDDLQGLAGAAETFADQVKALSDRFALARREARALGLDVAEIRKLEAQAIENIAQHTLGELEGQLAQQSRAIRDHFSGILDPLRDFRSSLDFGPLSANAPAQQFQLAQSQFQSLASQAANNNAQALRDLPSAAQAFIQQAQQFGASPAQAEAVAQVQRAFDAVISQQERMESEFTRDLPDAIDDSAEKQVKALREVADRLVAALAEVRRELQRNQKRVA